MTDKIAWGTIELELIVKTPGEDQWQMVTFKTTYDHFYKLTNHFSFM